MHVPIARPLEIGFVLATGLLLTAQLFEQSHTSAAEVLNQTKQTIGPNGYTVKNANETIINQPKKIHASLNTAGHSNMAATGNMTALSNTIAAGNISRVTTLARPPAGQQIPNSTSQYPFQQQYPLSRYQQQPNISYPPPTILSQSAYTSTTGTVHIVGEVFNQSPVMALSVKVTVTFYNAYNQVVGTDYTYTSPSNILPGQKASFDLMELSRDIRMNEVRSYTLAVDKMQ